MNVKEIQKRLSLLAKEWGADLVGFCAYEDSPTQLAPNLRYAMSIGVKLSDAVLSTIGDAPTYIYFQHYRTANALLDSIAFRLSREIEKLGYEAMPIAASQSQGKEAPYEGVVPHKTAAVLSGLGYVGKNGLFISTEYGSKLRLATILTDLPVEPLLPRLENGCGDCEICKKACPAGAILGEVPTPGGRNIDPEKCSRYMKEKFQQIGRGSVCGVCMRVCPKNGLK